MSFSGYVTCVLLLTWLSSVDAYVSASCGSLSSRYYHKQSHAVKGTDDNWGSFSSETFEEYENLLDLSSSIEPTKSNYNYLLDEFSIGGNDKKKENNTGILTLCHY